MMSLLHRRPKFNQIETLLGFAAATGLAAAVPAIAAIGLSLWFLNLLFQTYRDTYVPVCQSQFNT